MIGVCKIGAGNVKIMGVSWCFLGLKERDVKVREKQSHLTGYYTLLPHKPFRKASEIGHEIFVYVTPAGRLEASQIN